MNIDNILEIVKTDRKNQYRNTDRLNKGSFQWKRSSK